ncbi:MAG: VWA domain-containing protein [Clostridia bacterium]|nr:VWA domain-containing protein [Clostridia bacterium]
MADNTQTTSRNVDIVFCIDATGSMMPCLDMVKKNALKFRQDFVDLAMMENNTSVDSLNIQVIAFRDYLDDGDQAMIKSEWFDMLAGDEDKYAAFLNGIVADGGGRSLEESGLEALYMAMTTDWASRGDKDRQIIVLFTDADALDLMTPDRQSQPAYPRDMVDMNGLISLWEGFMPAYMSQGDLKLRNRCKRLIMYAPAGSKYEQLSTMLKSSQFIPVDLSQGLGDIDFTDVIKTILASVSSGS